MNAREELILKTAIMYYEENRTQSDIAKEFNVSRPTVSNMLKEAREKGIVKITIQHQNSKIHEQQKIISSHYGVQETIIVPLRRKQSENKEEVGRYCSEFLEKHLSNYQSIGIGWGSTMYEVVKSAAFVKNSNLEIVPLMGGIGINDIKYHSNHLAFQLAEKYQCDVAYFYAPALSENSMIYNAFKSSELVKDIYRKGQSVDLAIAGVGNPIESSTYHQLGYITSEERTSILRSGAIGDVLGSFFNKEGEIVDNDVSDRMFGIRLDDLEMIDEVLIMATGKEKTDSVKALLKRNFIDYLIIDSNIANALVEEINS